MYFILGAPYRIFYFKIEDYFFHLERKKIPFYPHLWKSFRQISCGNWTFLHSFQGLNTLICPTLWRIYVELRYYAMWFKRLVNIKACYASLSSAIEFFLDILVFNLVSNIWYRFFYGAPLLHTYTQVRSQNYWYPSNKTRFLYYCNEWFHMLPFQER